MTRIAVRLSLVLALLPATWGSASPANADSAADNTEKLVSNAVKLIADNGLTAACAAFNRSGSPFYQGDSYIFVLDFAGAWQCYPPQPTAVGQNISNLRDANGVPIVQQMLDDARSPAGKGWVDYVWLNPVTKMLAPKVSFVQRVPGQELFAGSGYYK